MGLYIGIALLFQNCRFKTHESAIKIETGYSVQLPIAARP